MLGPSRGRIEHVGVLRRLRAIRHFWLFDSFEGIVGSTLVAFGLVVMLFGSYFAPYNPDAIDLTSILSSPSIAHPFGTDDTGRDILSRVLVGAHYTLPIAILVVVVSVIVGCVIGAIAGYYGGWRGQVLMRVTDLFLSYPALLLAIAVAAALGPGLVQTGIALTSVVWASYARLTQVQVASIRTREYVEAAKSYGSTNARIIRSHVTPNSLRPILVKATMDVAFTIEWIAGLGFIGLGAQPPAPEWGAMVAAAREYVLTSWWYVVFPGLAILVVVLGFNLLGSALGVHYYGRRGHGSLSRSAIRELRATNA